MLIKNSLSFGKYIKILRTRKGLKLYELGSKLGIDHTLISKYETGSRLPTKEKLRLIADFFGIDYVTLTKKVVKDKQKKHFDKLASED